MTMARITVTITVIFSLFLLSNARHHPDQPVAGAVDSSVSWITQATAPLQAEQTAHADILDPVGLTLRKPIKIRCRQARLARPYWIRLPLDPSHRTRMIPLGVGGAGIRGGHRLPRGFASERLPFPMRPEAMGRMGHGPIDGSRVWMPMEHHDHEKRGEGGIWKRFGKQHEHEENKDQGEFKKRFWDLLNSF